MMKRQIFLFFGLIALGVLFVQPSAALAVNYKVKQGDSLYKIARNYGVSIAAISAANNLSGSALKPGQTLDIPDKTAGGVNPPEVRHSTKKSSPPKARPAYHSVKKGETIATIARKYGISEKQIMALNNVRAKKLKIGQRLYLAKKSTPAKDEATEQDDATIDDDDDEDSGIENNSLAINLEQEKNINEELLGKWSSPDERKLLVKVATGFLGAPYRLGGSTVRGIDCSAFVRKMYQFFDITLPRTAREQSTVGVGIDKEELVEGDLVFFRTRRPVGHVGIYVGNNEFVHASSRNKVVRIDSLETPYFQKRFVRAVRVKGLNEDGV